MKKKNYRMKDDEFLQMQSGLSKDIFGKIKNE